MLSATALLAHPEQVSQRQPLSTIPVAWSWTPEQPTMRLPICVERLDDVVIKEQQLWSIENQAACQFIYVMAGQITIEQQQQSTVVSAGTCIFIRTGRIAATGDEPARFTALTMSGILVSHMLANWAPIIKLQDGDAVEQRLSLIRRTMQQNEKGTFETLSAQAYHLLLHVSVHEQIIENSSFDNPTVAAAIKILKGCAARDLDVARVAARVGVSVSHLHRLFKRSLQTTPLNYAHQIMMTRAKEALASTDQSCMDIADQLGYDDPLYFSAVFKRHTGKSPRAYRRHIRQ